MRDIVLYFAGGTMTGVFGAGVATVFQERNIYPRVRAVYAASAGVMTGAYFLARQTALGSSIYWEDLPTRFISIRNFTIGVWQRFADEFFRVVPPHKLHDALDIERLMRIVTHEKPLDVHRLVSQRIPLLVKLFDVDAHAFRYVDARRPDALGILRAGIAVFPYVHELPRIDGARLVDAGGMEILGLPHIRREHPQAEIVVVLNRPPRSKRRYWWKNMIEGKFMQWMFDDPRFYPLYASVEEGFVRDIRLAGKDSRITLITPPADVSVRSRTTSPRALLEAYRLGREAGEEALRRSPFYQLLVIQ